MGAHPMHTQHKHTVQLSRWFPLGKTPISIFIWQQVYLILTHPSLNKFHYWAPLYSWFSLHTLGSESIESQCFYLQQGSRPQLAGVELLSRARAPTGFLSVSHPSFDWLVVSYPSSLLYLLYYSCLLGTGCPIEDGQRSAFDISVSFHH
jgi:hypothetical protein